MAYNGARDKLVHWLGYPDQCLDLAYEVNICRRGNIIDKKRGNIIKLDQHKYVRAAEHGLTPLSNSERKTTYQEAVSHSWTNFLHSYTHALIFRTLTVDRTTAISIHLSH